MPNRKHRDRNARALIVGLLVVGFVVTYWWAILAALAVAVADCLVWCRVMHRGAAVEQTRREHAALAAPADQQHAWVLAGDDRGIYGEYPPKQIAVDAGSIAYQRLCTSETLFGPWDL